MDFLNDIHQKIDNLKVLSYEEISFNTNSNFIELKKGVYKLNNNKTIEREIVTKKIGTGNASAIFAVTEDEKILLVIQPRVSLPTKDKINVELPAGYIEKGEDATTSAIRELEEETGYTPQKLIIADEYYPSLGASGEKITLLLALDCKKTKEIHLDSDEYLYNVSVTIDEFKYLLDNNYIKDVNARIGYYKYLEYIRKWILWKKEEVKEKRK